MLEVFILKIESPGCFWVGIKGGGKFTDDENAYKKLQSEMNQFYNKVHKCVDEIKPSALEEGQVCVVYCQELKSWCRAVVRSIRSCADYYLIECFLVDYAQIVPVKTDRICFALESFMRLPYKAKKFQLYCTKPVTLRVNYYSDKVETVPTDRWDVAAIQYFQNLLNVTTQVEAKLCAFNEDHFDVYLYVTIKGEKICVNDDLVAKNFACYELNSEANSTVENQNEKTPSNFESVLEEISPAHILWPKLLEPKTPEAFEMSGDASDGCQKTPCKPSQESDSYNRDVIVSIPPSIPSVTVSVEEELSTDNILCRNNTEMQQMKNGLCEKNPGVKLLQFLNPDPLKAADEQDEREVLLHVSPPCPVVLSNKIEPCSSLEMAPLFPALKKGPWSGEMERRMAHLLGGMCEKGGGGVPSEELEDGQGKGKRETIDAGKKKMNMEKMSVLAGSDDILDKDLKIWEENCGKNDRSGVAKAQNEPIVEGFLLIDMSVDEWEGKIGGIGEFKRDRQDRGIQTETRGRDSAAQTLSGETKIPMERSTQTEKEILTAREVGLPLPLPVLVTGCPVKMTNTITISRGGGTVSQWIPGWGWETQQKRVKHHCCGTRCSGPLIAKASLLR